MTGRQTLALGAFLAVCFTVNGLAFYRYGQTRGYERGMADAVCQLVFEGQCELTYGPVSPNR